MELRELTPEQCIAKAERLASEDQLDAALPYLTHAIALSPTDPYPRCKLASLLLRLGRVQEALETSDSALAISDDEWPHRLKAIALGRLGNKPEALTEAQAAATRAPDSILNKELVLDLQVAARLLTQAQESVDRLLAIQPEHSRYNQIAGAIALERMRWAEAEVWSRKAVALDATNAEAWNDLGVALLRQGKREDAFAAYGDAAEVDPMWDVPHQNIELSVDRRAGLVGIAAFFIAMLAGVWVATIVHPGQGAGPVLIGIATGLVGMVASFAAVRLHFRHRAPDVFALYRQQHRRSRVTRLGYVAFVLGSLPASGGLLLLVSQVPVVGGWLAGFGLLALLPLWRFGAPWLWRRAILPHLL